MSVCYDFCLRTNLEYTNFLFRSVLNKNQKINLDKVKKFCKNPKTYHVSKRKSPLFRQRKISKNNFEFISLQIFHILEKRRKYLSHKISKNNFDLSNWFIAMFMPAIHIATKTKFIHSTSVQVAQMTNIEIESFKAFLIKLSDLWQNEKSKTKREKIFVKNLSEKLYKMFN